MLISYNKNKFTTYVGYTNNIKKRLILHNTSKGAKFTKGKNWKVIYKKCYDAKNIAMKKEFLLKTNKIKRKAIKDKYIKSLK
jgi:putative endonuclease